MPTKRSREKKNLFILILLSCKSVNLVSLAGVRSPAWNSNSHEGLRFPPPAKQYVRVTNVPHVFESQEGTRNRLVAQSLRILLKSWIQSKRMEPGAWGSRVCLSSFFLQISSQAWTEGLSISAPRSYWLYDSQWAHLISSLLLRVSREWAKPSQ